MSEPRQARPTLEQLRVYAERFSASTTLKFFGVTVRFPTVDRVEAHIPELLPGHLGGLGAQAVNGGVLAAMFDLVIGCTGALVDPTRRNATMQLSMSFQRPVTGRSLLAEGWIDRVGGSTLFSSAQIRDERGEICARASGVVKLSKLPWKDGGSPAVN